MFMSLSSSDIVEILSRPIKLHAYGEMGGGLHLHRIPGEHTPSEMSEWGGARGSEPQLKGLNYKSRRSI